LGDLGEVRSRRSVGCFWTGKLIKGDIDPLWHAPQDVTTFAVAPAIRHEARDESGVAANES